MKYELIDHTADLGIRVYGSDQADLFANAALAMFDCLTDLDILEGAREAAIRMTGDDRADLMINWLRELLYLWAGKEMLVKTVAIDSISEKALSASVTADRFDPSVHIIKNEIKAVTYHQIQVTCGPQGWEARVIFDV